MEDKLFKLLIGAIIVLALAIPAGHFLGLVPMPGVIGMVAVLALLIFAAIRAYAKFGKDVLDLKCAIENPPKEYKPGDTVSYSAALSSKAAFELTKFSVTIRATYNGEQGNTMTSHKETRVHLENKQYVIGGSDNVQGSFKLPDDKNLFGARHAWTLEFRCDIKSALDKVQTIEFIKNDKTLPFWDSI